MRLVLLVVLLFTARAATAFYDPTIGKWISRDPIGEDGGINVSSFCENSPVDYFDELGDVVVKKKLERTHEAKMQNGRHIWGWTGDASLESERAAKLKYDKSACKCVVARKPELTFVVPMWVVKSGRLSSNEDATKGGALNRNVSVYVSSRLADAAYAHELRRFDAWSKALTSYFGREYEDKAANLDAPTCAELEQKIAQLREQAQIGQGNSQEALALLNSQTHIYGENISTIRVVYDSKISGVYVEYDLGN